VASASLSRKVYAACPKSPTPNADGREDGCRRIPLFLFAIEDHSFFKSNFKQYFYYYTMFAGKESNCEADIFFRKA